MIFEDLHPAFNGHSRYVVCNESIKMWRKALDGISVDRAAGICSAGDISFFGIFPAVKELLELIDHSYASMFYAIGKYHIIEKLSVKEAFAALSKGITKEMQPLLDEGNKGLPTGEAKSGQRTPYYDYASPGPIKELTVEDFKAFKARRKRIKFLHGDLSDLEARGPFELVYLSNALEYEGRDGKAPSGIDKIVKPGGYVCYTSGCAGQAKPLPAALKEFEVLFSKTANYREHHGMAWTYTVCQAPA